jgi:predicted RNase H-related nuclease YkuK (DUF458 family)
MSKKNKTKAIVKTRKVYKDPYTFDPAINWIWREYEGTAKVDLMQFINQYKNRKFFIGTDSHTYPKSRTCVFTSVIIAWDYDEVTKTGHGARVIRYTDKRGIIPKEALSAKLTVETQRSIEICKIVEERLIELSDEENDYMPNLVGVSIDCNYDEIKGKSGRYKDMLVGMVVSYGWKAFIKPDAFAASNVADSKC